MTNDNEPVFPDRVWLTSDNGHRLGMLRSRIETTPPHIFAIVRTNSGRWQAWEMPMTMKGNPRVHPFTFGSVIACIKELHRTLGEDERFDTMRVLYTNACELTCFLSKDRWFWQMHGTGLEADPSGHVAVKNRDDPAPLENILDGAQSIWRTLP